MKRNKQEAFAKSIAESVGIAISTAIPVAISPLIQSAQLQPQQVLQPPIPLPPPPVTFPIAPQTVTVTTVPSVPTVTVKNEDMESMFTRLVEHLDSQMEQRMQQLTDIVTQEVEQPIEEELANIAKLNKRKPREFLIHSKTLTTNTTNTHTIIMKSRKNLLKDIKKSRQITPNKTYNTEYIKTNKDLLQTKTKLKEVMKLMIKYRPQTLTKPIKINQLLYVQNKKRKMALTKNIVKKQKYSISAKV